MKSSPPIKASDRIFTDLANLLRAGLLFAALTVFAATPQAATPADRPLLHPLFCDHAVLQRGSPVPVWGWSEPGSRITVTFAGQSRTAVADKEGKWTVKLKSLPASSEPRTLSVTNTTT